MADDDNVVSFRPRPDSTSMPFPPLPPAPRTTAEPPAVADDDRPTLPEIPAVPAMRPPFRLPEPPQLESGAVDDAQDGEDGALVLPEPEDPDNPTARDTVQLAMALMTALGVAAAQGLWHRARHRSALADRARAAADKTAGKAAGAGHSGTRGAGGSGSTGSKGSKGSALRSEGRTGGRKGHKPAGSGKDGSDPRSRSRKGPKSPGGPHGPGGKAPKATRDGKRAGGPHSGGSKRRGRKGVKGGIGSAGPCVKTRKPGNKPGGKAPKATRDGKRRPAGKDATTSKKRPGRPLKWKAAKKSAPGPGGGKALPAGRKRWTGRTGTGTTSKPKPKQAKRTTRPKPKTKRWTGHTTGTTSSAPPPPPGWEWMRPPPGADRSVRVTVERVDQPAQPRRWAREPAVLAGAPATGLLALSAGPDASPVAVSAPPSTSAQNAGAPVSTLAKTNTQYADAELTIHDVIDADADMADEIVDGVAEAQSAAEGCDLLLTKLEALHAKVVELQVPGVLEGMVVALMEHTATVKAKAEAIAETLPRAAEAIATAGSNAEARHKPLADAVRDAGHIRPAERDYHNE